MVKLTALRPLTGDYGSVIEGQSFETDEASAEALESRGLAERHRESLGTRAHKMLFGAPENKARLNPPEPIVNAPQVIQGPPTVGRRRQ